MIYVLNSPKDVKGYYHLRCTGEKLILLHMVDVLGHVKKIYKWSYFKMDSELPFQRNCLADLTPQTFVMSKQGKLTFRLGLKQYYVPNNCLQR